MNKAKSQFNPSTIISFLQTNFHLIQYIHICINKMNMNIKKEISQIFHNTLFIYSTNNKTLLVSRLLKRKSSKSNANLEKSKLFDFSKMYFFNSALFSTSIALFK